jgi:hypothetical protein
MLTVIWTRKTFTWNMRPGVSELSPGAGGRNRTMIYGPKGDGTYIVESKTADGEALAISVPVRETRVLKHFQERMPYGLFVPDIS